MVRITRKELLQTAQARMPMETAAALRRAITAAFPRVWQGFATEAERRVVISASMAAVRGWLQNSNKPVANR